MTMMFWRCVRMPPTGGPLPPRIAGSAASLSRAAAGEAVVVHDVPPAYQLQPSRTPRRRGAAAAHEQPPAPRAPACSPGARAMIRRRLPAFFAHRRQVGRRCWVRHGEALPDVGLRCRRVCRWLTPPSPMTALSALEKRVEGPQRGAGRPRARSRRRPAPCCSQAHSRSRAHELPRLAPGAGVGTARQALQPAAMSLLPPFARQALGRRRCLLSRGAARWPPRA